MACIRGCLNTVATLWHLGADPLITTMAGRSPLLGAISENHVPVVRFLISHTEAKTQINLASDGITPLMIAAASNHMTIMESLLACPEIDVTSKDLTGKTALHWASCHGHAEAVKALLKHGGGAGPMSKDNNGKIPAGLAYERGHMHTVRLFAEHIQLGEAHRWSFSRCHSELWGLIQRVWMKLGFGNPPTPAPITGPILNPEPGPPAMSMRPSSYLASFPIDELGVLNEMVVKVLWATQGSAPNIEAGNKEVAELLKRYFASPEKAKREWLCEPPLAMACAPEIAIMLTMLREGYLAIRAPNEKMPSKRFFEVCMKLPPEIQACMALRAYGQPGYHIPPPAAVTHRQDHGHFSRGACLGPPNIRKTALIQMP